jgi:hypothetical protein
MATEHLKPVSGEDGYQICEVFHEYADGSSVTTGRFVVRGPGWESFHDFSSIEEAKKYISDNLNQDNMVLPSSSMIKEEQQNNVSSSYTKLDPF